MSEPGDTDWWSFQASAGEAISLFCGSQRIGSGVLDFTVRLFDDPGGAPLQQDIESATVDFEWSSDAGATRPEVPVASTGTHYLQIQASLFSDEVTGRQYQCGIFVDS